VYWSAGAPRFVRSNLGDTAFSSITLAGAGAVTGRTFDFTVEQSSTTGMTITVVEVGGSSYSVTGNLNNTETVKNVNPWKGYINLSERNDGSLQADANHKDWTIT